MEFNSIIELAQSYFALPGDSVTSFATTTYEPFFAYFDSTFNFPINVGLASLEEGNAVSVFTNPVTTQATLSFNNEQHGEVAYTLYDITGKVLQQEQTNNAQFAITSTGWNGLYIYELRFNNGNVKRGKIVFTN